MPVYCAPPPPPLNFWLSSQRRQPALAPLRPPGALHSLLLLLLLVLLLILLLPQSPLLLPRFSLPLLLGSPPLLLRRRRHQPDLRRQLERRLPMEGSRSPPGSLPRWSAPRFLVNSLVLLLALHPLSLGATLRRPGRPVLPLLVLVPLMGLPGAKLRRPGLPGPGLVMGSVEGSGRWYF